MDTTDSRMIIERTDSQKGTIRCYVPARFILVALLFFGTCTSYMLRIDMSLAIVAMINKTSLRELENDCSVPADPWCVNDTGPVLVDNSACPFKDGFNDTSNSQSKDGPFVWNSKTQGVVLGSFFYGYASTQLLGGRLGDRLGPKWLIGGGILAGSLLSMLVPVVAHLGVWYLVALRVVTGMTQGCLYPGLAAMFNRWIPASERSRFYCLANAGAAVGVIICMPLVGILCDQTKFFDGWPSVFYTFGGIGVIWSIIWMFLSANDPASHPRISASEKKYILERLPENIQDKKRPDFPWKAMLTSIPIWAHVFAWCTSTWIMYIRLTELPNYLDQVLHIPIKTNGSVNAIVNCAPLVFSICGGFIADYIISSDRIGKTKVRKTFECLALLGSSGSLIMVTLSGCETFPVIAWLTISSGFQSLSTSGDNVLAMDMTPSLSGTVFGFGNTFCTIAGFICPLVVGFVLSIQGVTLTNQWHYIFYLSTGFCVLGSIVVIFFWSAEVQPWDPSVSKKTDDSTTVNCNEHDDFDRNVLLTNE